VSFGWGLARDTQIKPPNKIAPSREVEEREKKLEDIAKEPEEEEKKSLVKVAFKWLLILLIPLFLIKPDIFLSGVWAGQEGTAKN